MRTTLLIFIFASLSIAEERKIAAFQPLTSQSLHQLLKHFEREWSTFQTFQVRFKQTVYSKTLGGGSIDHGQLYMSKPNQFRWEFNREKVVHIGQGNRFFVLQPGEPVQVFEKIPKTGGELFLQMVEGRLEIKKHYIPKLLSEDKKTFRVELKAKTHSNYRYVVTIDKETLLPLSFREDSPDTIISLEFSKHAKNSALSSELFHVKGLTQSP